MLGLLTRIHTPSEMTRINWLCKKSEEASPNLNSTALSHNFIMFMSLLILANSDQSCNDLCWSECEVSLACVELRQTDPRDFPA